MRQAIRIVVSSLILMLLLASAYDAFESASQKRVLVLYSEEKGHPAHDLTDQGIREAFRSNKTFEVKLYSEYVDESRFPGPDHHEVVADYLRRKYSGTKIDTVIAVYPSAVEFLFAKERALFGVPIIACAISRSFAESLEHSPARRFITGAIVGENAIGLTDDALRMRPDTKRVALVAGMAPNDEYSARLFREALIRHTGRIELIDLTKLPMKQTLKRVETLPPATIVLYAGIAIDGAGQHFVGREALSLIARAANAPVFGPYDSWMGFGMVGGPLSSFEGAGRTAADLALRVMAGESPSDIPFASQGAFAYIYDWRELNRWGITEKSLPAGSIVKFKPSSIWEDHRGTILGGLFFVLIETLLIVGLFVNLHKRKKAEVEIAESALRYRTVADYTYDWEYWSAPDGTLNYVSPSCERVTGYSVREFIGNPSLLTGIIVLEDNIAWNKHSCDARGGSESREVQFRIRTRSGEIRWIDHACQPVKDAQGKSLGTRASNRDITDRKKAEFEAQQHRGELARVNRLGTMGELTSSLAHELNQPLTAIRNYANAALRFISKDEPDLSKTREALDGIVQNDRRAAEVIQRVRALLRREEPHYDLLDINNVIGEILTLLQSDSILEGLSIKTELAPGLPAVQGDRVQLQQVLVNMVLNGVAAMHAIRWDLRKVVIKTEKQGDQGLKVSVRDAGVGIDEAHKDKMFQPFYTTKPEGMGMGLPISVGIIHAHGGSMGAENNPDRGATFYFTLPTKDK
jgi:PAS domain S-box-containing protein